MQYFIDTNIFLRFLTKDDKKQFGKCRLLFEKAEKGKINLITSALVIFETIWTLASFYEVPKRDVVEMILSLVELENLEVENKNIIMEALFVWQQENIDFNDAFNYVWAQKKKAKAIYSYDKHFERLTLLPRLEP
jgi:predicted nucleic-acid-binding protein